MAASRVASQRNQSTLSTADVHLPRSVEPRDADGLETPVSPTGGATEQESHLSDDRCRGTLPWTRCQRNRP